MSNGDGPDFDSVRAELFEALSHPNRIKILKALSGEPMGFSELRRAVGMESSGLLSFHLQKLTHLVKTTPEGAYVLTDEGKEALRMAETIRHGDLGLESKKLTRDISLGKVIIAALLIGFILIGTVAFFQQQQIGNLNHSLSSEQAGSVLINGTRYWQLGIPLDSTNLPAAVQFNGVKFNLTAPSFPGNLSIAIIDVTAPYNNTTFGQVTGMVTYSVLFAPNIQVTFADGQTESHSYVNAAGNTISWNLQTGSSWFTHHSSPRAGVSLNSETDSLELYVSVGT